MKYADEYEAKNRIMKANGVTDTGLYIEVVRGSLGLKRLGALDFLRSHCKRKVIWVNEATKKKKPR